MWLRMTGGALGFSREGITDTYERIPAGIYNYTRSMMGPLMVPVSTHIDTPIRLTGGAFDLIQAELDGFFDPNVRERVRQAGLMHRKGLLLHGPHGNGKTMSVLSRLSDFVKHNAVVVMGIDPDGDTDNAVEIIRHEDPERPIVIVWDEFDQYVKRYEYDLLSLLDGDRSHDNIMYVGMLNDLRKVPSRLFDRPSRFNATILIDRPNAAQRDQFITARFPQITGQDKALLVKVTTGLSLDHLKHAGVQMTVYGHPITQVAQTLLDNYMVKQAITNKELPTTPGRGVFQPMRVKRIISDSLGVTLNIPRLVAPGPEDDTEAPQETPVAPPMPTTIAAEYQQAPVVGAGEPLTPEQLHAELSSLEAQAAADTRASAEPQPF